MPNDKTVQLQLDRPRNWRFTTGARIRLCDRLNVPDGLQEVIDVIGSHDEDEGDRVVRLKSKDAHVKLAALVWCGQIQTEEPIKEADLLEILDDSMIAQSLPLMLQSITASMGNPTEAPEEKKPALEAISA